MTKLRHYDQSGTARFVTFSTYHGVPALNDDSLKQIIVDELKALRAKYGIRILGYVLMPNHVHLVLHPPNDLELGRKIGELKSLSARRYFAGRDALPGSETRILWERRSYDHNCRDIDSVVEKINYCHNNPVRKGLAAEPGEWLWSSHNWYNGHIGGPLEIDMVEI